MSTPASTHSEAKPPKSKTTSSTSFSRQRRSQQFHSQPDDEKRLKSPSSLSVLKEMFPLWKDDDLLSVLAESGNDPNVAAEKIYDGRAQKWGEVKKKTKERSKKQEHESIPTQDKHNHNSAARTSSSKHFPRGPKFDRSSTAHNAPRAQRVSQKSHANGTTPAAHSINVGREPTATSTQPVIESAIPPTASPAPSNIRSWADMAGAQSKPVPAPIPAQNPPPTSSASQNDSDATITVKIPSSTALETSESATIPPEPSSAPDLTSKIPTGPAASTTSATPMVIPTPSTPAKKSWADIAAPPPAPKQAPKPTPQVSAPETAPIEPAQTDKIEAAELESSAAVPTEETTEISPESVEETETEPSTEPAATTPLVASISSEPEDQQTSAEPIAASSESSAVSSAIPTGPAATTTAPTFSTIATADATTPIPSIPTDSSVAVPPGFENITSEASAEQSNSAVSNAGLTSAPTGPAGTTPTAPASGSLPRSNSNDTQRPMSLPSQPAASSHSSYTRRLNQESPVVLPGSSYNHNNNNNSSNNNRNINRVSAQFGSLNLAEDESSQDKNEISAPTQPRAAMEQHNHDVYSQQAQQAQQQQNYNNYNRFNQRSNNQYQQHQSQAQQPQTQQAGQPQGQQQIPHKSFDNYNQNQFMYPGSHPGYAGFSYGDYSYPTNDAPRNNFGGYYSPYLQQHPQDALNRGLNQYEQPGLPQQTNRYNSDKTQIAAGSTNAAAQSPANSTASPGLASSGTGPAANQYNNLPYFVNPYYTYPYFMSNNYGNQKPYYGQQSYFNGGMEYRSQQGGPQQGTQQTPQQQPGAQQPGAQQGQQQGAVGGQNTLSGISDFLQREDKGTPGSPQALVGAQMSGQSQLHQSQPQPQYQPNMYSNSGYGNYGGGRQNWNYN